MKQSKTPYTVKVGCPVSIKLMDSYWDKWNPPSAKITAEFIKEREEHEKTMDRMSRVLRKEAFINNCIGFGWLEKLPKHRVVKVSYLYGYKLRITFENHVERNLDFEEFLYSPKYEHYEALQDIEAFKKVTVDHDELYWDKFVLDIKADDLYNWQNVLY